ncbi:MAG: hypothetical protein V1875_09235 [Candidatus Altiarchaeota archaeon]
MNSKRLYELGVWNLAALVFIVSLAARLLSDLVFQLRFGAHATNHIEIWLFTGVAEGSRLSTGGLAGDPTIWLMRLVGAVFPGGLAFYGVMLSSAVLSSLTASAIFLIASELYDRRTGLIAGIIYAGMVEPIGLSTSGYTHDHLQLLLISAAVLFAVKASKSGIKGGIICSIAFYGAYEIGRRVNPSFLLAVGIILVYVIYALLAYLFQAGFGRKSTLLYPLYVSVVLLLLFSFGRTFLPPMIEGSLDALPQGRMGSADIVPANANTLFIRYNILLLLLPVGVVAAYRREDLFGLLLTAVGFMLASIMDRGTRISDLGVAFLAAYAIVEMSEKAGKKPLRMASALLHAILLAGLVKLSVDYALLEAPAYSGWALPASTYLLLAASAIMGCLILQWAGATNIWAGPAEAKAAARKLFWNIRAASVAAFALLALAYSGGAMDAVNTAYGLVSVLLGTVLPHTMALSAAAAFPVFSAAIICAIIWRRYLETAPSGIHTPLIIVFFASFAALGSALTARAYYGHFQPLSYPVTLLVILAAFLAVSHSGLRRKAQMALAALVPAYVISLMSPIQLISPSIWANIVIFATAAAAMIHVLNSPEIREKTPYALAIVLLVGLAVNVAYAFTVEARKVGSDAEYEVYKWLRENGRGGRILVPWDHGYMAEVVSGLGAVSTPGYIDQPLHDLLWRTEPQAASELAERGVRYVFLNNETFNIARDREGGMAYKIMGGLIMPPADTPPFELADHYAIYRLRHNTTSGHFRLVKAQTDKATGMQLLLYENLAAPVGNASTIGAIAVNVGTAKTVRILAYTTESANGTFNMTYHLLGVESFKEGEVRDLIYEMPSLNRTACALRAASADSRPWNFTGSITFRNELGRRTVPLRLTLVPTKGDTVLDTFEESVQLGPGEKKTVGYFFQGADEFGDYSVDVGRYGGLAIVPEETTSPMIEDVRIFETRC